MALQINYKTSNSKNISSNLVLFVDEKFNISGLKKNISNSEFSYISDLLKNSDLKKDLLVFKINSKKTIFLVSIKKDIKTSDIENLGAKFHSHINYNKKSDYDVDSDTINGKVRNFAPKFSISEVVISFLIDAKNIDFFELISKTSKSFFKSLFFNKSEM